MVSSSRNPLPDIDESDSTSVSGSEGESIASASGEEEHEQRLLSLYQTRSYKELILLKKRWKLSKQKQEEERLKSVICTKCGLQGHKDGRSKLCPENARNKKGNESKKRKGKQTAEEKSKKQEAKRQRLSKTKWSGTRKCRSCAKFRPEFLAQNPHGSNSSNLCPDHKPSKKQIIEAQYGGKAETFIRKTKLTMILKSEHRQVLNVIHQVVDFNRTVVIKASLFVIYYLQRKLASHQVLSPVIFQQVFFYSVFQLLLTGDISSKNEHLPKEELKEHTKNTSRSSPPGSRSHFPVAQWQ
ncbi:uncharacterized protein BYT42DRAFT_229616 [Radiomyces spectabilis]|uniref:uncharacterized protein n=1 Tax=Radiomyces spectabilis TaxID=64574 RepID=UPI0022201732|nr:uncharacterized protein BYT42DRAFT_229616 [Radiomyces spectabilis]KAI8388296.1 hypothetical protein BYT42DRAFT_229616 [Radiomyces spectabilis]